MLTLETSINVKDNSFIQHVLSMHPYFNATARNLDTDFAQVYWMVQVLSNQTPVFSTNLKTKKSLT